MKAGIGKVDITPAVGIDMGGFLGREQPSAGIHDRLYAKALIFAENGEKAVLVSCDLLGLTEGSVQTIRSRIAARTDIPQNNIMISCTHTHSGPATMFLRNCGKVDEKYQESLYQHINDAVELGFQGLREVKIGCGEGISDIGVHRTVGTPHVDPTVSVLKIEDMGGKLLAALINYACHPVVMAESNRLISADFPGTVVKFIKKKLGEDIEILYTNGACGNINPVNRGGTFQDLEYLGSLLGTAGLKTLENIQTKSEVSLKVATKRIHLPLQLRSKEEIEKQKSGYHQELKQAIDTHRKIKSCQAMLGWAEDTIKLIQSEKVPESISLEIQLMAIDDINLIGIPGEVFSPLGWNIKRRAGGRTIVLGYTNGNIGYLPTQEVFKEGGYEAETAYKFYGNFMIKPESAQIIEDEAVNLAKKGRPF